ncbi:hypothetical protein [Hydrogenophaga sp.]|uniref:hypothetical protein n=1 Tax=Hydrogenophaga sp. TaxID=1904254 RepID=UPI003D11214A
MPEIVRPLVHPEAAFTETLPQPREPQRQVLPVRHWLSLAAAFADIGGLVSDDELADLIRAQCTDDSQPLVSQPISLVARWIVAQRVLTVESPWGRMLPLFQFDLPRAAVHPGMRLLLAELRGVLDDVELALWFVTPNEWLGGARPALAMQTMLPAVRDAARADRFVALGG